MTNRKVSDMNKDYIINFLQEYSHYIKNKRSEYMVFPYDVMCPTEFFNIKYLKILKETEETDAAFGREPGV